MTRYPVLCFEQKRYLKKGTWTPEEDLKLKTFVLRFGVLNWNEMPKYAGLLRTGKSCRLRWMNYLRPGIKRGNFTKEEEETILKLHKIMGNRWAEIAQMMPERTDNEIKNYFNTRLKKRAEKENSSFRHHHEVKEKNSSPEYFSSPDCEMTNEESVEGLFEIYGELQGFWDQPPMLEDVLSSKFADLYT